MHPPAPAPWVFAWHEPKDHSHRQRPNEERRSPQGRAGSAAPV